MNLIALCLLNLGLGNPEMPVEEPQQSVELQTAVLRVRAVHHKLPEGGSQRQGEWSEVMKSLTLPVLSMLR